MRIAVFLPNWVGDVVMATPAIHALRQRWPKAWIAAIVRPYVRDVLAGAPWFDAEIPFDKSLGSLWSVASRLRRERVETAILFTNTFRSGLAAWLGRCRRRIGVVRYGRGRLLTDRVPPLADSRGRRIPAPIIDVYNRLAELAGAAPDRRLRLFTTEHDEAAAERVWRSAGWDSGDAVVCLNPGAAFGSAKYWSVESFANLAWRFASADRRVLVLCGPAERTMARQIAMQAGDPRVRSLADGPLSLGLTKACVRRSDLLVTTDSGPRHFAAAFDKPVVTLFGPTHIAWTETYHAKAQHIQKSVPCGPCQLRTCPLDHRCMTGITPEEVFAAAESLLHRYGRPREVRHAG